MIDRILVSCDPGEWRIAALQGERVEEFCLWRPGAPDGVGDVYWGRVIAHLPALGGSFVALAGTEDGFLPDSEGAADLTAGAIVPVRVTRAAQGGKGPRLSARFSSTHASIPPQGPLGRVMRGPSALERLAQAWPKAAIVIDDPAVAAALPLDVKARVQRVACAFDDALEAEVETLLSPVVQTDLGPRLSIHPTPALVAIDIDAGRLSSERQDKARAQQGLNRMVLPHLVRQIRLRNLSGAIFVDFAGLSPKKRVGLRTALEAELATDRGGARLLGFTALGLAEIVRPRVAPPLHEYLSGAHAAGLRVLKQVCAQLAGATLAQGVSVRLAPAVVTALQADPQALDDVFRRVGHRLKLVADPGLVMDQSFLEMSPT